MAPSARSFFDRPFWALYYARVQKQRTKSNTLRYYVPIIPISTPWSPSPPHQICDRPTSFSQPEFQGRSSLWDNKARGGNLGGTVPQSLRWGDGPRIRPPNILRSSVVGCARKYEKSLKRCFSCEARVILVRKGSCTKGHVRHLT